MIFLPCFYFFKLCCFVSFQLFKAHHHDAAANGNVMQTATPRRYIEAVLHPPPEDTFVLYHVFSIFLSSAGEKCIFRGGGVQASIYDDTALLFSWRYHRQRRYDVLLWTTKITYNYLLKKEAWEKNNQSLHSGGARESHPHVHDLQSTTSLAESWISQIMDTRMGFPCPFRSVMIYYFFHTPVFSIGKYSDFNVVVVVQSTTSWRRCVWQRHANSYDAHDARDALLHHPTEDWFVFSLVFSGQFCPRWENLLIHYSLQNVCVKTPDTYQFDTSIVIWVDLNNVMI